MVIRALPLSPLCLFSLLCSSRLHPFPRSGSFISPCRLPIPNEHFFPHQIRLPFSRQTPCHPTSLSRTHSIHTTCPIPALVSLLLRVSLRVPMRLPILLILPPILCLPPSYSCFNPSSLTPPSELRHTLQPLWHFSAPLL